MIGNREVIVLLSIHRSIYLFVLLFVVLKSLAEVEARALLRSCDHPKWVTLGMILFSFHGCIPLSLTCVSALDMIL